MAARDTLMVEKVLPLSRSSSKNDQITEKSIKMQLNPMPQATPHIYYTCSHNGI